MTSLLTTLLMGGLIIGAAVVLINPDNRCNYLGLCGQTAAAAPVTEPIVETTTGTIEAPATETNLAPSSTGDSGGRKSRGCCVCEDQGGKVKCQKSGTGVWFNPPAGSGGSNDTSLDLSLDECNKDCGSSSSTGIKATGSVKAGAGAGGNKSSGSSNKSSCGSKSSGAGGGAKVSSGASIKKPTTRSSGAGAGAGVRAGASFYTMSQDGYYYEVPSQQSYYSSNRFLYPDYPRIRGGRIYFY